MARTKPEIKKAITDDFISNPNIISLYGLTPGNAFEQEFSLVSLENILFDIVAFFIYTHEQIVSKNAENSRPHTIRWYLEQAFNFIDGCPLIWVEGQFKFDTTGLTEEEVQERKIIARCAALESNDGELVFKVGKDNSGTIEPLSSPELTRFIQYMNLVKDAGNRIRTINQPADSLRMTLNVYVDVSIIDLSTGQLLNVDTEVYPVKDAVKDYLANLEFNGAFVKEFLKNKMQSEPGIKLPLIQSVEWKYASFDWAMIEEWKVPQAGYFSILDADLTINYLAYDLASS